MTTTRRRITTTPIASSGLVPFTSRVPVSVYVPLTSGGTQVTTTLPAPSETTGAGMTPPVAVNRTATPTAGDPVESSSVVATCRDVAPIFAVSGAMRLMLDGRTITAT